MSIHKRTGKKGPSYQVRYRHADGTQASRTFRTKKDAERFYGQVKSEDGDFKGLTSQQRKITFGAYATMWQRTKHGEHSMKTKVRCDQILRLHVLPQLGHMTIRSIRRQHLRDLIVNWEENKLSAATIRTQLAYVGAIFRLALDDDVISKDPTVRLKLPALSKGKGTVLNQEQCQVLLSSVNDHHRRIFYTLLVTGLRIGELFELRVGDIHQRERLLEVRRSKTCNGVRSIHLSENDLAVLREQIESLGDEQDDPNAILFRSPEGKPLHYRNLAQRVLKKVISDAGLHPFTFHDFRKTHATMLVAAGIDPKVVQDRMGHVDIKTTLEYYAQPTKEGKEAAAQVAMRYLTEQIEKSTDSSVYSDLVKLSSQ